MASSLCKWVAALDIQDKALYSIQDALGVEASHHPMQGRDTQGGLVGNSSNMEVEAQATVHCHSQHLDVFLDEECLASKAQAS
ncbi:hypothetical protein E2C01_048958 [Portunus trituberculatus]|uniref:Uncharacterized protein n=1 Tax=Portunus trituberculatus TaxID=210409 RepID=A0A5B7GCJ0_PORTR|nr:hypothetical protein [Portunus trituberculatus]